MRTGKFLRTTLQLSRMYFYGRIIFFFDAGPQKVSIRVAAFQSMVAGFTVPLEKNYRLLVFYQLPPMAHGSFIERRQANHTANITIIDNRKPISVASSDHQTERPHPFEALKKPRGSATPRRNRPGGGGHSHQLGAWDEEAREPLVALH